MAQMFLVLVGFMPTTVVHGKNLLAPVIVGSSSDFRIPASLLEKRKEAANYSQYRRKIDFMGKISFFALCFIANTRMSLE